MSELKSVDDGTAAQTVAETLKVEKHVLISPHASIRIASIATLSVVPIVQRKPSVVIPVTAIIVLTALAYALGDPALSPFAYAAAPNDRKLLLIGAGVIVAALLLYHFAARSPEQWRLLIGTSDGRLNHFAAPRRETLEEVRDLLVAKINRQNSDASYDIDFRTGDIRAIQSNSTGKSLSTAPAKPFDPASLLTSALEMMNATGARAGQAQRANGLALTIDYSGSLPMVSIWAEHFRSSKQKQIADRLIELEQLMRAGTPTAQSKARVQELTDQLNGLLSGATEAATLFGSVSRTASFGAA